MLPAPNGVAVDDAPAEADGEDRLTNSALIVGDDSVQLEKVIIQETRHALDYWH